MSIGPFGPNRSTAWVGIGAAPLKTTAPPNAYGEPGAGVSIPSELIVNG